jgi:hypothetical protein
MYDIRKYTKYKLSNKFGDRKGGHTKIKTQKNGLHSGQKRRRREKKRKDESEDLKQKGKPWGMSDRRS